LASEYELSGAVGSDHHRDESYFTLFAPLRKRLSFSRLNNKEKV